MRLLGCLTELALGAVGLPAMAFIAWLAEAVGLPGNVASVLVLAAFIADLKPWVEFVECA